MLSAKTSWLLQDPSHMSNRLMLSTDFSKETMGVAKEACTVKASKNLQMENMYTIGHSTRTIEEFIELLQMHQVQQLIDIRTIPKSRHNPQFAQEVLDASLKDAGIQYIYLKALGGLRSSSKNSINTAWRNRSFRNYADYMQTDEFTLGIKSLLEVSHQKISAIMCAEAVPWRCHRSLVGDALTVRNVKVLDIISKTSVKEHNLTSFAIVDGTTITYPGE